MASDLSRIFANRTSRHLIFWAAWVFGFTFIQSYGESLHHYFAWFSYYMVTLPIFVAHTYLVAYWLLPVFARKGRYLLLTLLFLALLILFSVLELVVSNEFIFRWFPTGSDLISNYLQPGHVLVSGLGNLYIVMVFLAARTIRNAFIARDERSKYHILRLEEQYDQVNRKLQPGLLLFAVDQMVLMAAKGKQHVSAAIASTSDLMNDLMRVTDLPWQPAEDELRLIRKLIRLHDTFNMKVRELEVSSSADLTRLSLKPLVLFIIAETVIRACYGREHLSFHIAFSQTPKGENIRYHCLCESGFPLSDDSMHEMVQKLQMTGAGVYGFSFEKQADGLTVMIQKTRTEG